MMAPINVCYEPEMELRHCMNITGVKGLIDAEKATLKVPEAVEDKQ